MALGSTVPALLLAVTQIIVSDTHPAISKIVSSNEMRDVFSQYENSTHSLLITTDSSTNLRWTSMRESTVDENSSVPSNFDSTSFVSAIPRSYTVTDRKKSTMSPMLKTDKNIVTTTVDVLPKNPNGGKQPSGGFEDENPTNSHFIAYLIVIGCLCAVAYVVVHRKNQIIGLIVEGRRSGDRRRDGYRRLPTDTTADIVPKDTNIVY